MAEPTDADSYWTKAVESLASAESDFAAGRVNSCANRAYYACFQAAISVLLREGIRPGVQHRQWTHPFVEGQFVGQLINRRHRYPTNLRAALAQNRELREQADYRPGGVPLAQAERSLRRAREFVRVLDGGDGRQP